MNKQLVNQLLIIKAAVNTALEMLMPDEECTHPEEARIDYSTMGGEAWGCRKCGYYYKESE